MYKNNLSKKYIPCFIVCILLFSIFSVFFCNVVGASAPTLVYVDDDYTLATPGWGYDHFDNISQALEAVEINGTVYVHSGIYRPASTIYIMKTVTLIGENKDTTIIDGQGIDYGIGVCYQNSIVHGFTIKDCGSGITIWLSWNVNVYDNIVTQNTNGILFIHSSSVNIFQNEIINNEIGINISTSVGTDKKFYHNTFIDNTQNAYDPWSSIWDNGLISGGNYWDDYTGIDANGDGIGDTSYAIPGGAGQDRYPLMNPYLATGSFQISSSPGGATIHIDDISQGMTPKLVSGMAEGYHTIRLEKTGYQSSIRDFYLVGGYTKTITVILVPVTPAEGTITGVAFDSDTQQPLMNTNICVTKIGTNTTQCVLTSLYGQYSMTVSAGTYTVEACKDGYQCKTTNNVVIQAGRSTYVNCSLIRTNPSSTGWIHGYVYDASGNPLLAASVCATPMNGTATDCTITDSSGWLGYYKIMLFPGSYKVQATKLGYQSQTVYNIVVQSDRNTEVKFYLEPEELSGEGTIFGVVTDEFGFPIPDVTIYAGSIQYATTNAQGAYSFGIASGTYYLTASKTGYIPFTKTCSITYGGDLVEVDFQLQQEPHIIENGWVYGTVFNTVWVPLEDVSICVFLGENQTSRCTFTEEKGWYNISLSPGAYIVTASKKGYELVSAEVIIKEKNGVKVDFTLTESSSDDNTSQFIQLTDIQAQLIEEKITSEVKKNRVAGKIDVEDSNKIFIYNSAVEIQIQQKQTASEIISFIVRGNEEITGQVFVVRIPDSLDEETITVEYDGMLLNRIDDLTVFFEGTSKEPVYIQVSTKTASYYLFFVPHFSEHEISIYTTISEVVDSLGGITAVAFYITTIVVVALIYIIPIFVVDRKK